MPPSDPTNENAPLDDAARQRLVAYLDGELSAEESRAVESELAADRAVRGELQRLERVWNALDALPATAVDDAFTRSTVELVVEDARQEVAQLTTALPARRRRRRWGAVAACLVAMAAGGVAARTLATRSDRRVLAHLPVIYQYDALRQFEGPGFLRRLWSDAPQLVAEYAAGEYQEVSVAERAADWRAVIDGGPAERAAWIARQTDTEKLRLQRAVKRFGDSPAAARQQAGRVLGVIASQPDADQLLPTAIAYEAWLATQPATEQAQLRQIEDPAARVARVRRLYNAARDRAKRRLGPADAEALREAVRDLAGDPRLAVLPEKLSGRRLPSAWRRGGVGRGLLRVTLLASLNGRNPERALPLLSRLPAEGRRKLLDRARKAWPPVEARLLEGLAVETQERLSGLTPPQRAGRLAGWLREAAAQAVRPDNAALEAFFASEALSDSRRHELLALPVGEMKRRLGQDYFADQMGGVDVAVEDGSKPRRGSGRQGGRAKRGGRRPPGKDPEGPSGG